MLVENLEEALHLTGMNPTPQQLSKMKEANRLYPMRATRYFLRLAQEERLEDPILLQVIPHPGELQQPPHLSGDPLGEEAHSPVPHLVHRYPDRAVLLVTSRCALRCRHCNRKRFWKDAEWTIGSEALERVREYLGANPQVREIILSGGDPLTLAPVRLGRVMEAMKKIPSVKVIRVGTRVPVVAPWLVTPQLTEVLREFQPVWINLQFNHPREVTPQSVGACRLLREAGAPLGNQTVLLKGVNDSACTIKELCYLLVEAGVRPYYLFQCDLVEGVEHLRTPVRQGIEIIKAMVGHVSGIAVPTFAIDAPGGKGKTPLLPDYQVKFEKGEVRFRSYAGDWCRYPDPVD